MLADIISRIDENNSKFEKECKKINVLDAILWIGRAWNDVSKETIVNCFISGISNCYNPEQSFKNIEKKLENKKAINDEEIQLPVYDNYVKEEEDFIKYLVDKHSEYNDKEIEIIEEEKTTANTLTRIEAFDAIEKLELYFLQNFPEKINTIWEVKQLLTMKERREILR